MKRWRIFVEASIFHFYTHLFFWVGSINASTFLLICITIVLSNCCLSFLHAIGILSSSFRGYLGYNGYGLDKLFGVYDGQNPAVWSSL
jgi:hypothetical protein